MRYLSVCSGIEAASVAWESLGWTPVAFAEIEKFPSKVLAHHYPGVANLGDMTKFREWDIERDAVDVLVGGTPCQSFSVAGLRKGLDDPRGNLALTFIAMVEHFKPEWVIWENVPGVLSSSGGRDFGSFLGALGQLGYGFAYRVLDAQYFGVPQRRRRVFVIAHSSGDSRRAAEILFEPESLRGDSPKSNRKGEKSTSSAEASADVEGGSWPARITGTLDPHYRDKMGLENQHIDSGATLFVLAAMSFVPSSIGDIKEANVSKTITANTGSSGETQNPAYIAQPIALAENTIGRQPSNGGNHDGYTVGGPMYTLNATGVHGVAHPAHAFNHQSGGDMRGIDLREYPQLQAHQQTSVLHGMAVRRLTPSECERLQGFPDGYTDIMPETPDGPRYKALGNSMAVPVMRWIGSRIALATK
jgi:DNA (cytosine-5)-methyltransferase 1